MTVTPRIADAIMAGSSDAFTPAPPVTAAEIDAMSALARARRAHTVTVGHSRDEHAADAADLFARAWRDQGGTVFRVVSWPDRAASWLRPAQTFTDQVPDLWVVVGTAAGWAQMARRLTYSTEWKPGRTLAFEPLATPATVGLAGRGVLDGLSGPTRDGAGTWRIDQDNILPMPFLEGTYR